MWTVETERRPSAPPAHRTRGLASRGIRATARLLGVCAAVLAFGLLGLLVTVWHLTRGRPRADLACCCCRRRRDRARAGTFVLAGLVLAGSGMAVHQDMSNPDLPPCGTELPEPGTGEPDHSLGHLTEAGWLYTRQVLTAPISGLARNYVDNRGGGLCEGGSMTLAFLPSGASDSGLAVGSVVLTGAESSVREGNWEAMARHESRHVNQWATFTLAGGPLAMPLLYAVDQALFPESRNHFERAAGLEDGGYQRPDGTGPRPEWVKVGLIVLVLVIAGWRRLRWTSRVLTGGTAAAVASHRGRCPLHSRGWFRLARH
ncbi:MAG: hypothetical protein ACRDO4_11920 [Nocardioides sp.]